MQKYLLLIVSLLFMASAYAQNENEYRIQLKNGSVIFGSIDEFTPNKSIKITSRDGSQFIINEPEVVRIEKTGIERITEKENVKCGLKSFYEAYVNVGDVLNFGVGSTVGWQFTPHFFAGVGCEIGLSDDPEDYLYWCSTVPIYGCAKWNVLNKKVSPILDVRIGGDVTRNFKFYNSNSIGCRINFGKVAISPSIGLQIKVAEYWEDNYSSAYPNKKEGNVRVTEPLFGLVERIVIEL